MQIAAVGGKTGNPGAQCKRGHVGKTVIDKQELRPGLCWRRRTWLSGVDVRGGGEEGRNSYSLLGFAPDALEEVERFAGAQATELFSCAPKAKRIKL